MEKMITSANEKDRASCAWLAGELGADDPGIRNLLEKIKDDPSENVRRMYKKAKGKIEHDLHYGRRSLEEQICAEILGSLDKDKPSIVDENALMDIMEKETGEMAEIILESLDRLMKNEMLNYKRNEDGKGVIGVPDTDVLELFLDWNRSNRTGEKMSAIHVPREYLVLLREISYISRKSGKPEGESVSLSIPLLLKQTRLSEEEAREGLAVLEQAELIEKNDTEKDGGKIYFSQDVLQDTVIKNEWIGKFTAL